jgi:hypothetical protein
MDLEQIEIDKKITKRGRKPKNKDNIDTIKDINDDVAKKKRGRKPTGKIYEINKSLMTSMNLNMPNCIIAHLPLTDKDIEKIIGKEDNTLTDDMMSENIPSINLQNNSLIIESDDDIKNKYDEKCIEYDNIKKKYDELTEKFKKFTYLEDKMTDNGMIQKKYYINNSSIYNINGDNWNTSTDNWCLWCSHGFETVPIGLPEKYCIKKNKYYLRGCFCSFNCAMSYNYQTIRDYKVHERFSLLNKIKKIIFNNSDIQNRPIIAAPPREILKCFGGEKTIEEFRNSCIPIPKEYNHLLPPIIPIFTVIEEIPKFFYQDKMTKKKNDFGELKIKRTKPLLTQNNNLLNLIK